MRRRLRAVSHVAMENHIASRESIAHDCVRISVLPVDLSKDLCDRSRPDTWSTFTLSRSGIHELRYYARRSSSDTVQATSTGLALSNSGSFARAESVAYDITRV